MTMKRLGYCWLAVLVLLTGCAGTPERHAALVTAEEQYQAARNNQQVLRYAHEELSKAESRLAAAQNAWEKDHDEERVEHLAYMASQQVGIAQSVAARRAAEEMVANAEKERENIRLQARTQEAERAQQRARQLEQQLQELSAKQTERGVTITLGDVLFDTGSAVLKPQGVRSVQKLADYLKQHPERRVMVEGFTDSVGSEEFNQRLSERRADSVRDVLIRQGVERTRISTMGYGEAFPIASNDNAGGRQLNRRVEVIVSDESGNIPSR